MIGGIWYWMSPANATQFYIQHNMTQGNEPWYNNEPDAGEDRGGFGYYSPGALTGKTENIALEPLCECSCIIIMLINF